MTALDEARTSVDSRAAVRAAWFRDARALLEYLEGRPDLPLPCYFEVSVPASAYLDEEDARHAVGAAAEVMGVEPEPKSGGWFGAGVSLGAAHYCVFSMSRAALRRSRDVELLGTSVLDARADGEPAREEPAEAADEAAELEVA